MPSIANAPALESSVADNQQGFVTLVPEFSPVAQITGPGCCPLMLHDESIVSGSNLYRVRSEKAKFDWPGIAAAELVRRGCRKVQRRLFLRATKDQEGRAEQGYAARKTKGHVETSIFHCILK